MKKIPNWLIHSYGVAETMYKLTKDAGWGDAMCENAWLLGLLHDIGKRFGPHEGHEQRGASILARNGYDYYSFVRMHGFPFEKGVNIPWQLEFLMTADLSVDQSGKTVSIQERLDDIKARRGEKEYEKCKEMADFLIDRNLKKVDSLENKSGSD